ncbi:MAG: leucine-rich repeat domain-containing protein [Bacteroidota bacterium]
MSIKKIIFIFLIGLFAKDVIAQNLLDSLTLSQQKVYKDLDFALNNADSVFALDLSKKKLKVVPDDIKKLPNLQWLKLEKNNLKDIPPWIGDLVNLQYLDLSNNDLIELPSSIGKLENVYYLGLNRNLIENLPHEMGQMKNLQVLEMWDNELEAIPEEMKNLHNLQVLELRGILFSNDEQMQIESLLPDTKVMFSPSCNCTN